MRNSKRFTFVATSCTLVFLVSSVFAFGQLKWMNVDSLYQPLPKTMHVFTTTDKIDTGSFRAYYVVADLLEKKLDFTVDTTFKRRLTPSKFYEKNDRPVVIVNCTFFSFETNHNLNLVIKNGKILESNVQSLPMRGKDTLKYFHTTPSAIGVSKKGDADVAWTVMGSSKDKINSTPLPVWWIDSSQNFSSDSLKQKIKSGGLRKWKMKTAVGGGPVLLNNGEIKIANNEERKFAGKAINDKHPRTAMGYTKDHKLIILVVQGRSESSGGATLPQEAQILKDLGCVEALNLDGGGSSCMLVNGKETIKPSDKEGERPVPAVFIIKMK